MLTQADLIQAIERYIERERTSATAFGIRVARDPCLVFDLRSGRSPRLTMVERIMSTIAEPALQSRGAEGE